MDEFGCVAAVGWCSGAGFESVAAPGGDDAEVVDGFGGGLADVLAGLGGCQWLRQVSRSASMPWWSSGWVQAGHTSMSVGVVLVM